MPLADRVCLERRQIDNGEFGRKTFQLCGIRLAEQVMHKQAVPSKFGNDLNGEAVIKISSAKCVLAIKCFYPVICAAKSAFKATK